MGGPTLLPAQYDRISDWDLIHIYLAPRDKDGDFVTLRQRFRNALGWHQDELLPDDEPEDNRSPLEKLGVPRAALFLGVPVQYVTMFFAVWRRRNLGLDDEQILEKLKEKVKEVPTWGGYGQ